MEGDREDWGREPVGTGSGTDIYLRARSRSRNYKTLVFCFKLRIIQFKGEYPFNFHRGVNDTFMSEKA